MSHNVSIEFLGGPHDGLIVAGPIDGTEVNQAEAILRSCDGGRPGAEVWLPTPYALEMLRSYGVDAVERLDDSGYRFPGHTYEIFVRRRRESDLLIRARHIGVTE